MAVGVWQGPNECITLHQHKEHTNSVLVQQLACHLYKVTIARRENHFNISRTK